MAAGEESKTRSGWRLLGCAFKVPLGCLAFALGALFVFVVFLPPAAGKLFGDTLEREFAESHRGRLEIGEAWLGSFYGPQRIERFVLRGPSGAEVLSGELRAPSLRSLVFEEPERWGPVEITLASVQIVEGPAGRTNLAQALEAPGPRLPPEPPGLAGLGPTDAPEPFGPSDPASEKVEVGEVRRGEAGAHTSFTLPEETIVELRVEAPRVAWRNAAGRSFTLVDLWLEGEWDAGKLRLAGAGTFEGAPAAQLALSLVVDDELRDRPAHGRLELAARGAPVEFLQAFVRAPALEAAFGGTLDELELSLAREREEGQLRLTLELRAPEVVGSLSGLLHTAPLVVLGDQEDRIELRFGPQSWWSRRGLAAFLPLAGEVELVGERGRDGAEGSGAALRLEHYELPLHAPLELSGTLALSGRAATWSLPAELSAALALEGPRVRTPDTGLGLEVEGGEVRYDVLRLQAQGGELSVRGRCALPSDACELVLRLADGGAWRVQEEPGELEILPLDE